MSVNSTLLNISSLSSESLNTKHLQSLPISQQCSDAVKSEKQQRNSKPTLLQAFSTCQCFLLCSPHDKAVWEETQVTQFIDIILCVEQYRERERMNLERQVETDEPQLLFTA